MNLYEIQIEYQELMRFLEENEGELTPELEDALKFNEETFKDKALNYVKLINKLKGDISLAKLELNRVQSFINKRQLSIDMLERNLVEALKLFGDKDYKSDIYRYEVDTYRLSTRKSNYVAVDEKKLPEIYKTFSIENLSFSEKDLLIKTLKKENPVVGNSVSKTELKNLINSGEEIQGASIETKYSLNIK